MLMDGEVSVSLDVLRASMSFVLVHPNPQDLPAHEFLALDFEVQKLLGCDVGVDVQHRLPIRGK